MKKRRATKSDKEVWRRILEDAGWEIRDCIMWVYGSGFPKSLNIGKAVDKLQGTERVQMGVGASGEPNTHKSSYQMSQQEDNTFGGEFEITKGNTIWEGYGTALKPAYEPIMIMVSLPGYPLNQSYIQAKVWN